MKTSPTVSARLLTLLQGRTVFWIATATLMAVIAGYFMGPA